MSWEITSLFHPILIALIQTSVYEFDYGNDLSRKPPFLALIQAQPHPCWTKTRRDTHKYALVQHASSLEDIPRDPTFHRRGVASMDERAHFQLRFESWLIQFRQELVKLRSDTLTLKNASNLTV